MFDINTCTSRKTTVIAFTTIHTLFFYSETNTIRVVNKGHTLYQSRRARYVALRGRLARDRVIVVFTPTNTTSGYHH